MKITFTAPGGALAIDVDLGQLDRIESLLQTLTPSEARIVSALSDKIAALKTSVDAALTRVELDVNDLQAKITELQAKVDAGGATEADIADLETLQAKVDALDPVKPATLPPTA